MPQTNQWGEPVDQWGNPIPEAYLPPEYYDPQQSPYPDGGYGGDTPYYGGGDNPAPEAPYAPPGDPSVPPPAPTGGGTADPSNPAAFIQSLLSGVGYGAAGLKSLVDKFKSAGYNVWVDGNGGARGIITDPSGKNWNVLDQGEGTNWWTNPTGSAWNVREYQAGGGGGTGGAPAPPINPEYLAPWTDPTPTQPTFGEYAGPADFAPPTADSILTNPGYQFRRGEGQKALENNAASRGVLNTGGTLKDFMAYGDGLASQQYDKAWDQQFGAWNASNMNSLNTYNTRKDASQSTYDNAWKDWISRRDTFYANQNNPWNKQMDAARVGAGL